MSLDAHPISPWTEDEVRRVAEAFDLGEFGHGAISDLSETGWDAARARCRLETTCGAFFLKKHHPKRLRRESHAVINAFRARAGRAPEIIATSDGGTWFETEKWTAEVHRIVPGEPPARPNAQLAMVASGQVAVLHSLSTELTRINASHWYDIGAFHRELGEIAERLRAAGLNPTELEIVVPGKRTDSAADLPLAVAHGDLWRGNWVVDEGHVRALTDFDWVRVAPRIDDISDVLLAFCSDRDIPLGLPGIAGDHGPLLVDRARRMLQSYGAELTDAERSAAPDAMRRAWLRHTSWLLQVAGDAVYLSDALEKVLSLLRMQDSELIAVFSE